MVDKKADAYKTHLAENRDYAQISSSENEWLLQDDAYMAEQLRQHYAASGYSDQGDAEQKNYDIGDLMFAGIYAKSLSSQLEGASTVWNLRQDDSALGVFLAKQDVDTREIAGNSGLSRRMENLVNSSFAS